MSYNIPENISPTFTGGLGLRNEGETNSYMLKPPDGLLGDITLTLPPVLGEKDYILKTDGLGNLSWSIEGALSSQGSTKKLTLSAPASLANNVTLTFPPSAGSAGEVLATDGAGGLSWVPQGGGGGGSITGVFGTAGQIASSGGAAPVLSLIDIAGLSANTYGFPTSVQVDAKGRVISISAGTAPVTSVSGAAGQIAVTGTTAPSVGLATVANVAGSYTSANITVDAYGRVTNASNGTGGSGAPSDAEYLVLTANGGLTNEKVLGLSANLTQSIVGSAYTLDLSNTAVTPNSYTNATITVDAKGRVTAASNGVAPVTSVAGTSGQISVTGTTTPTVALAATGTAGVYSNPSSITTDAYGRVTAVTAGGASGAPSSASYLVASAETGLSQERVLAVTAGDLVKTDGGGGGNMTLGLATTGISAGTYLSPGSVTVDSKGRVTGISSGFSRNTGLTADTLHSGEGTSYYGFDTSAPVSDQSIFNGKYQLSLNETTTKAVVIVKDETGNAQNFPISVFAGAAGSIDGQTSFILDAPYQSVTLVNLAAAKWAIV